MPPKPTDVTIRPVRTGDVIFREGNRPREEASMMAHRACVERMTV